MAARLRDLRSTFRMHRFLQHYCLPWGYLQTFRYTLANIIKGEQTALDKFYKICKPKLVGAVSTSKFNKPAVGWLYLGLMYRCSVATKNNTNEWEGEKEIVHKITLAQLALKEGDRKKAEDILEGALRIAEEKGVHVGVPCAYEMLATIAYQQGDITRAEQLLIRVIERMINSGTPENDNQIVNFSLKLCKIYSIISEDSLAELGYRNCLAVQKDKIDNGVVDDETRTLWINTLFWYGRFLSARGRYDEAKQCLERAYAASAQVSSILPAQIMVILYNLSEVAFAKKDYDGALRHLLSAVILGKETKNPELPSFYAQIGLMYLYKDVFDEAKMWCEAAKKRAKAYNNKDAEKKADECLDKIGKIMFA